MLLTLLLEVRNIVYQELLSDYTSSENPLKIGKLDTLPKARAQPDKPRAILQTCRRIRSEASSEFFHSVHFQMHSKLLPSFLSGSFSPWSPLHLRHIHIECGPLHGNLERYHTEYAAQQRTRFGMLKLCPQLTTLGLIIDAYCEDSRRPSTQANKGRHHVCVVAGLIGIDPILQLQGLKEVCIKGFGINNRSAKRQYYREVQSPSAQMIRNLLMSAKSVCEHCRRVSC